MNQSLSDSSNTNLLTCANCGAAISPDDRFCGTCGAPIAEEVKAPLQSGEAVEVKPDTLAPLPEMQAPGQRAPMQAKDTRSTSLWALPEVLGIWTFGWLAGGLIGTFVFAEILYRAAFVSGSGLPGVMLGPLMGDPPFRMVEGINLADASLWALFGLAGGALATLSLLLMRKHVRPVGFAYSGILTLLWGVSIVALINIGFFALVPVAGALIGALYAGRAFAGQEIVSSDTSSGERPKVPWPGIGLTGLAWFLASVVASLLVFIVQNF